MKMELDLTQKKSVPVEDVNIDYTKRILLALDSVAKTHKVDFNRIKAVFISGATEKVDSHPLILCGFARVNMYLRLLDPSVASQEFKAASNNKNFKKLIFDFSSHLSPKPEDYERAKVDLNNYKLNFDFESLDSLYLEDAQTVPPYKHYL
jgi:hypothetical protein